MRSHLDIYPTLTLPVSNNTFFQKIVFIDKAVDDYQSLANSVALDTKVVILDAHKNGVQQITETLEKYTNLDNIHIVSHGSEGKVQLGSAWLGADNLQTYSSWIRRWRSALGNTAEILLYGCNVAAGHWGEAFVHWLSYLTGANVAASTDLTGNAALGGDWDLEHTTGPIQSSLVFPQHVRDTYSGVLATFEVLNTNNDGLGSLRAAIDAANRTPIDSRSHPHEIKFGEVFKDAIPDTIQLRNQIVISNSIEIKGPGSDKLTISGAGFQPSVDVKGGLFRIEQGTVTLADLTLADRAIIQNGGTNETRYPQGGALHLGSLYKNVGEQDITPFNVTLKNVVFRNNLAESISGAQGGAIYVSNKPNSSLQIISSQFLNNRAIGVRPGEASKFEKRGTGGAIFIQEEQVEGGADRPDVAVSITSDTIFLGNDASDGLGQNSDAIYGDAKIIQIPLIGITPIQAGIEATGGNAQQGIFRLSLTPQDQGFFDAEGYPYDIEVNFTVAGSAQIGDEKDYRSLQFIDSEGKRDSLIVTEGKGKITIPARKNSVEIFVDTLDDEVYDPNEAVTLTLDSGSGYKLAAAPSASLIIADNEPVASLSNFPFNQIPIPEGSDLLFQVTLDRPAPQDVFLEYEISGTATPGEEKDYIVPQITSVLLREGEMESDWIIIKTNDDQDLDSFRETVVVTLKPDSTNSYGINSGNSAVSFTILDNETKPTVSLAPVNSSVNEGVPSFEFQLNLSEPALNVNQSGQMSVNYEITRTSTNIAEPGSISIKQGQQNGVVRLSLPDQDFIANPDEVFTVRILPDDYYTIGADNAAALTIRDVDSPGVAIAPIGGTTTTEFGGTASFEVKLNSKPTAPVTVTLVSSNPAEGVLIDPFNQEAGPSTTLTFDQSNWNQAKTIGVKGVDDNKQDGDQPYQINVSLVSSDSEYNSDRSNSSTVLPVISLINKDDDTPNVIIVQTNSATAVAEGGTTDTYQVRLTSRPTQDVVITLDPNEQLDLGQGVDTSTTLRFTPDNATEFQTVVVAATDDREVEGTHRGLITHSIETNDLNYQNLAIDNLTVQITDNDLPTVSITPVSNASEESRILGRFNVSLGGDRAPEGGLKVNYSIVNTVSDPDAFGVATPRTDYDLLDNRQRLNGTVTIPQGESGAQILIDPVNDQTDEQPFEEVTLQLSPNVGHYKVSGSGLATVNITDLDVAGVTIVETGSTRVTEGGASDSYTVSLNSKPNNNVTIQITPDAQVDVAANGQTGVESLTFTPTNWKTPQTVTVQAVVDTQTEGEHQGVITHKATSNDGKYQNISINQVTAAVSDRTYASRDVADGLQSILTQLQSAVNTKFLTLDLPLLQPLNTIAPGFINLFRQGLVSQIRTTSDLTGAKLAQILRSAIAPYFPDVSVTTTTTLEEETFQINLGKRVVQSNVSLSPDAGLPALGLSLDGKGEVVFEYDLSLGFGLHRDFGFYVDPTRTQVGAEVDLNLGNSFQADGSMGFLKLDLTNHAENPTDVHVDLGFSLKDVDGNGVDRDGDRITLAELRNGIQFEDLFDLAIRKAEVNLGLEAKTIIIPKSSSSTIGDVIPSIVFDLSVDWPSFSYENAQLTLPTPTITINNTRLDLGTFISKFLKPIVNQINDVLEPFRPVIDLMRADTKLFTTLGLGGQLDANGDGIVTILDLIKKANQSPVVERFIEAAETVIDLVTKIGKIDPDANSIQIDLGSFELDGVDDWTKIPNGAQAPSLYSKAIGTPTNPQQQIDAQPNGLSKDISVAVTSAGEFKFPLLTNPQTAINLLLGQETDLFSYDFPDLSIGLQLNYPIPIYPPINGLLFGGISASTNLGFGFDTVGLEQWKKTGYALGEVDQIFNGFYASDNREGGQDAPELTFSANIGAGLGIDVGVFAGYLKGGIDGNIYIDLRDVGETKGSGGDGKLRGSEVVPIFKNGNIGDLFNINGDINAFLAAQVDIRPFPGTVYEKKFATFNVAKFTLLPQASFKFTLLDGYTTGGIAFFDADFDNVHDDNEPFTVTNQDGTFDLDVYLPAFDLNGNGTLEPDEGRIVVIEGIDTSTFLPQVTPLTSIPGATIISPLTTIAAELVQQGVAPDVAQAQVKTALGLPTDTDLFTDDPLQAIAQNSTESLGIFSKQIQVQNLIVQVTRLLDGGTAVNSVELAERVIEVIAQQSQAGSLNLNDSAQLTTIIQTATLTFLPDGLPDAVIQGAAKILAEANQRIEAIATNPGSLSEAAHDIARVQQVAQGAAAEDLAKVGAGEKTIEAAIAENTGSNLEQQIQASTAQNPVLRADFGNDSPFANPDSTITSEGIPVTIDVLSNDTDADNDPLTVAFVATPTNGTATVNANGTISYTPKAGFIGSDVFNYVIRDGATFANSTITVNVQPFNEIVGTPGKDVLTGTEEDDRFTGAGNQDRFVIRSGGGTDIITDFGAIGRGARPSRAVNAEVDTIQFEGSGLIANQLILTEQGRNIEISFEGVANTHVILQNVALEQLDNLPKQGKVAFGNILFDGQATLTDSVDVFDAKSNQSSIWHRNSVTFLNNRSNNLKGFDRSNDVINAQGGNDAIRGLSGDDILRGASGNDILHGGAGTDVLVGGVGNDTLDLGQDQQADRVLYRLGDGTDNVYEFKQGVGGDLLSFENIPNIDVVVTGSTTLFHLGDGLAGNANFGLGQLLVALKGMAGFAPTNIALNLASTNTAQFAFA